MYVGRPTFFDNTNKIPAFILKGRNLERMFINSDRYLKPCRDNNNNNINVPLNIVNFISSWQTEMTFSIFWVAAVGDLHLAD